MTWVEPGIPEDRMVLVALLVLSVFVMAIALTGTAAAEHGGDHDEVLDTEGERFWVGQTVLYEEGRHPNDNGVGSLYEVRESATNDVVSEVEEDSDGHVLIGTRDLGTGSYRLFSPQGEDLFAFEVGSRFAVNTTQELFTAFRQEPDEVAPRTIAEGLRISLQAEDGTSADYNLYGAFLQNGDLIRDGFSSSFTAEAGGDNSVPVECDSGTEFEPPCSVLGDFLNAGDVPEGTPFSLYVPNKSVFDDASFSSEGPQRFPDSLRDNLQSASQQGPVLFLAPTGATAEVRSQFRTQPVIVVPENVDLGIGWNPIPRQPIISPSYIEINQAVQNKIVGVPSSGQNKIYGTDAVRILPNKDTVVRYYLTTAGRNGRSLSVSSAPDLKVTVRSGASVARTFTISPNTGQSSVYAPPDPLFISPQPPVSGAREDLVRDMRADTDRTLNYVIPEDKIEKPSASVSMSLNLELVQSSSSSFSEGGQITTAVCCRSVLGYNAVRVDPPGSTSAPSYSQVGNNVLKYIEKSYPISDLSLDWKFYQWDGNNLKKDLKQAYGGRSSISGTDYTVIQGIRPRPYNVGNAWCPGKISQTGLDGNVAAQEVGHSLDLEHISSTHNTGGFGNEPTPYSHGVIGEFDLSGSSHETAPGKWGNVGAVVQPVKAGNTYDVRVIPAGDPDSSSASDHVHEFMSYGNSPGGSIFGIRNLFNVQNGNGAWVSDTIYERLYAHINVNRPSKCNGNDQSITRSTSATGEASSQSVGDDESGEMVDALVFTATLNGTEKSGQVIRKPMPQSLLQEDEEQEGEYTVEFQNGDGEVMVSRSFDLLEGTGSVQGEERVKKIGQVAAPNSRFDEDIERIVVRDAEMGIWFERDASPNAPEVRVLTPNGGETWEAGTQTIPGTRWEVSDPDGDPVGVLIEYSPDRGESWEPLGFFDPGRLPEGNSIEIDVGELDEGELEPSTEGLIRVAATDGVNTAQDRSDETFSVVADDDSGESIDDIQTTLSDTDGDELPDQVQVEVTVSDVGTGQTTVELGETEFDVDVSQTDTGQAQFVTPRDSDGDGTPEAVEFVELGTADATYTVIADLSNQDIGDTGTVEVELGSGNTDSATYTVEESTGQFDPNNPFVDPDNNPVSRGTVIDRVVQWNLNDNIGGTSYTRDEIIGFVVEWNLAN